MEIAMKAVGLTRYLPIEDPQSLVDLDLPRPLVHGHDLLVAVKAVSVNPVDTKVRAPKPGEESPPRVLGWDAAGVVEAVGPAATLFKPGDEVFYAGSIDRSGSNAEHQLVNERIVGRKPRSLSFADAAALPLTSITAWELMFDRMRIAIGKPPSQGVLLIIGAAGGVGSIATQLARRLTGLTVIGSASRPETRDWVLQMGAHHVVDHRQPLAPQLGAIAPDGVNYVLSLTATDQHFAEIADIVAPQGHVGLIDDPQQPLDIRLLKRKSVALHWEFMYTRPLFNTPDVIAQHRLLNEVADLVDAGLIRSTRTEDYGVINAANLRRAHALLESGKSIGKIVLSGFPSDG
jgi:zinc-binding alcohol dehydrogenase family protein